MRKRMRRRRRLKSRDALQGLCLTPAPCPPGLMGPEAVGLAVRMHPLATPSWALSPPTLLAQLNLSGLNPQCPHSGPGLGVGVGAQRLFLLSDEFYTVNCCLWTRGSGGGQGGADVPR